MVSQREMFLGWSHTPKPMNFFTTLRQHKLSQLVTTYPRCRRSKLKFFKYSPSKCLFAVLPMIINPRNRSDCTRLHSPPSTCPNLSTWWLAVEGNVELASTLIHYDLPKYQLLGIAYLQILRFIKMKMKFLLLAYDQPLKFVFDNPYGRF